VSELQEQIADVSVYPEGLQSTLGIAHTRWATHGVPAVHNAHPHFSHGPGADAHQRPGRIALVHNGIIENHETLRAELQGKGYVFVSQTDTEVMAHLIDSLYAGDVFVALKAALKRLHGAYALAVFCADEPQRVVGARQGSPLILGVGGADKQERFLASDAMALAGVTDQIVYLEEGDAVDLHLGHHTIEHFDAERQTHVPMNEVNRPVRTVHAHSGAVELGPYRHYMQKEIFEQPRAIADTLEGIAGITPDLFGPQAAVVLSQIQRGPILVGSHCQNSHQH
jgi:glucosamine--fructose-6-phosphate aminotransferase (isomerizing)